ncbi:MAG: flavodoxin-dependent (E)-4-hydroxy-3-methylbut-2-enyl-diphosphate synthase [Thermodesulfovibrionales bacterium]
MARRTKRKKTRRIFVGAVPVGGGSPVSVQSMTKTDTRDAAATVRQIRALEREGCEIIRLAVPDAEAARALGRIKKSAGIPVIADIHFDWRLALEAVRQGVDGLRINPGNIGAEWKIREVVSALADRGLPLRVGVNAGSLEKDILRKHGHPSAAALVESAERQIALLEKLGFGSVKVSLKASNVPATVEAYRMFAAKFDYPLHIGISEAGPLFPGLIKSSVGLGLLLSEGIGDTMRVSLTANPREEVRAAYEILRALGLRRRGVEIVSCPTCGRCQVELGKLVAQVERKLGGVKEPLTVAVMGCAVNGPGEAREADFGIASGKGRGLVFRKGKVVAREREDRLVESLLRLIEEEG